MEEMRASSTAFLREQLERACSLGELPSGTDCSALASYFMAIMQGMSVQARDGATHEQLLALADLALRVWP